MPRVKRGTAARARQGPHPAAASRGGVMSGGRDTRAPGGHRPVMLREVLTVLEPRDGGTQVRITHAWDGPRWPLIGGLAAELTAVRRDQRSERRGLDPSCGRARASAHEHGHAGHEQHRRPHGADVDRAEAGGARDDGVEERAVHAVDDAEALGRAKEASTERTDERGIEQHDAAEELGPPHRGEVVQVAAQRMADAINRFRFGFQIGYQLVNEMRPPFSRRIARIGPDGINERDAEFLAQRSEERSVTRCGKTVRVREVKRAPRRNLSPRCRRRTAGRRGSPG